MGVSSQRMREVWVVVGDEVGAKGRKNRGMGRGDRGRSGVVKPGVPWGRGRGMELIRDGAAYGVEL